MHQKRIDVIVNRVHANKIKKSAANLLATLKVHCLFSAQTKLFHLQRKQKIRDSVIFKELKKVS